MDGVRASVESGEISALGVNTLWLSPLYANPDGTFPGGDGRRVHELPWLLAGSQSRRVEVPASGRGEPERTRRVGTCAGHSRPLRRRSASCSRARNPYYAAHKSDGWFQDADASCVCGSSSCDWSTHIEDCWFTPYLPTFDWSNSAVADQASSDVVLGGWMRSTATVFESTRFR